MKKFNLFERSQSHTFQTRGQQRKLAGLQLELVFAKNDFVAAAQKTDDLQAFAAKMETFAAFDKAGIHSKQRIVHQHADFEDGIPRINTFDKAWFKIFKINAGERLLNVQFARHAVQPDAVPIKHAIGGVRVLLDFKNDIARANG